MPSTNAERQRRYRNRALKDPDGLILTRPQVMLSAHATTCLSRIVKAAGKNKREVVEESLIQMERNVTV